MLKAETAELKVCPDPPKRRCLHIITCEFPPQYGGVSDYTETVARSLADKGYEIHVWCPGNDARPPDTDITVHRALGAFSPTDLRRAGEQLDDFSGPRNILVQWVPHGYGYRSMNLPFCWWLYNRARRQRDRIQLMVHEPYLPFRLQSFRQNGAALIHRLMTIVLLRKAERVWMSIPEWEQRLKPYTLGRKIPFEWLPVVSNVIEVKDTALETRIRRRYASSGAFLVGHFGTFGPNITSLLEPVLIELAQEAEKYSILLMGIQSDVFREALVRRQPQLEPMVKATGALTREGLSSHIAACDLLIQPYPDGVSTRRGSFLAGLSHRKPIVTTTGDLTESFWPDSGAVALAPAGDANQFVELIRALRQDPGSREELAHAAKVLYDGRFDVRHIIATLDSAY